MTDLGHELEACRAKTFWLLDQVPDDFLRQRVHGFYSPIGWHFGHIARTEEYWTLTRALRQPCEDEHLSFIFADLPENPKDNRVHIPNRKGIVDYMEATRRRTLEALSSVERTSTDPLLSEGYAWSFALQHECQHQETIAEMLQLIQMQSSPPTPLDYPDWRAQVSAEMVRIPRGSFCMGSDDPNFYDNEKPSHTETVEEFRLARYPVSAYQWSEFIADGGYKRKALWSINGWEWRENENATLPEYWVESDGRFSTYSPIGLRALHPDEPVASISWHEAAAYTKWSGKRLPTEVEWEYAAAPDSRRFPWGLDEPTVQVAQFGMQDWSAGPIGRHLRGASAHGIEDLAGSVWEWTSSPFLPYSGFVAYPYDGYSKDHMLGEHRVCRGGSWATAAPMLRCSFRNWYVAGYRQGFLGLRLAE